MPGLPWPGIFCFSVDVLRVGSHLFHAGKMGRLDDR